MELVLARFFDLNDFIYVIFIITLVIVKEKHDKITKTQHK